MAAQAVYQNSVLQTVQKTAPFTPQVIRPTTTSAPPFSPAGTVAATLTIASAVSIGSNMVDVRNGAMTIGQAVLNGVVKGTAATVIINSTARSTTLQVGMAAAFLASAGYLVDTLMKKNKQELCSVPE